MLDNRRGTLDVLRVVAVVAVLLYHADHVLPGGLVGVSVFFTLSGCLIGGQLWQELERTGGVEFGRFWSRRVRRLLPASLVVIGAVVALWPALGYELSLGEVAGSVLPVRNWSMLAAESGYGAGPSPTAHFWSLAVEEQIYLVVPVVLLGLWRLGRPRLALALLVFAAAASSGWAAWLAAGGRLDRAYLGTDARIGEVLLGIAVAVWLHRRRRPLWSDRGAGVAVALALAVILALSSGVHWPSTAVSTWAIPAAALAAAAVCAAAASPGSWAERLGRRTGVRTVSDHAYELYLVHVPVFALLTTYRTGWTGTSLLVARLAATALAAAALHRLVHPIRTGRRLGAPRSLGWALGGVATALVVAAVVTMPAPSSVTVATQPVPPELLGIGAPPALAAAATAPAPASDAAGTLVGAESPAEAGPVPATAAPLPTATTAAPGLDPASLWMVGDSTLRELDDPEMTEPRLSDALTAQGWKVSGVVGIRALATCGERPFDDPGDDLPPFVLPAAGSRLREWWDIAPAATVLVQLGSNDLTQFHFSDEELIVCLALAIDSLPADVRVVWVLPSYGPWCWCDVDRAHADAERFAEVLRALAADRPRLTLASDPLAAPGIDQRATLAEDGIHATLDGRALRVAGLVDQLGVAPA